LIPQASLGAAFPMRPRALGDGSTQEWVVLYVQCIEIKHRWVSVPGECGEARCIFLSIHVPLTAIVDMVGHVLWYGISP